MSNCWRYKKKSICSIKDIPKEFQGDNITEVQIIYRITNKTNGEYYLGKRILFNNIKKKLSQKRRLELGLDKRTRYEYFKQESVTKGKTIGWQDYYGSSKNEYWNECVNTLGHDKFDREILMFVEGKTKAAFYEAKYLFSDEGMMNDKCMNLNILSKFFKNKLK